MSTAFGVRPQLAKGPPPTPVVLRERIPPAPNKAKPRWTRRSLSFAPPEPADLAAAWWDGFRAGETCGSIRVSYESPERDVMMDICEEVAKKHGVTVAEMRGHMRTRMFVLPRFEAIWRCAKLGKWSTAQLGHFFGSRHHTTIMHAIRTYEKYAAKSSAPIQGRGDDA